MSFAAPDSKKWVQFEIDIVWSTRRTLCVSVSQSRTKRDWVCRQSRVFVTENVFAILYL